MTRWFGIAIVAHLLGFMSLIMAIMTTRTPQDSIAWAISLNTFPYIAVPAYWVFGRNHRKVVVVDTQTWGMPHR